MYLINYNYFAIFIRLLTLESVLKELVFSHSDVMGKAITTNNKMTIMNYDQDFATVNLILDSDFETRGVDAFILSLIKAEKQMRRIFTYLIFQNPAYNPSHYTDLRNTLAANKRIYFEGFIKGFNLISSKSLSEIYGENYVNDIAYLINFEKDRNKIFHGQITSIGLKRDDLISRVNHIKKWCKNLADKIDNEIGYDGFGDSLRKSKSKLELKNEDRFDTFEKYANFLKTELQR